MERFTGEQRAFCVKAYYQNGGSCTAASRAFRTKYNIRRLSESPSVQVIKTWVKKFEETGSTLNKKPTGPQSTITEEVIQKVVESVQNDPELSLRKRSGELGIPRTTLARILKEHVPAIE